MIKWTLYHTSDIIDAITHAKQMGWAEQKVQLRYYCKDNIKEYFIEPYEEGSTCPCLLKYEDFFTYEDF